MSNLTSLIKKKIEVLKKITLVQSVLTKVILEDNLEEVQNLLEKRNLYIEQCLKLKKQIESSAPENFNSATEDCFQNYIDSHKLMETSSKNLEEFIDEQYSKNIKLISNFKRAKSIQETYAINSVRKKGFESS